MLDPLFDYCVYLWQRFKALFSFRLPKPEEGGPEKMRGLRTTGRIFWRLSLLILIFLILTWNIHFLWNTLWIRGFNLTYPQSVLNNKTQTISANEQIDPEGSTQTSRTCGRSQIVDMQAYLLNFLVNENTWMPSMPQYKAGLLGLIAWQDTPFFDNKAAFQLGVLTALRRTSVELTDILGRERGTSQVDSALQSARGLLSTADKQWWINPFDPQLPFGPTQPAQSVYRQAIRLYENYNDRLEKCQALFDARADNLIQFLDRIAKDTGSSVDILAKRSQGIRYDAKTDTFVEGEGNDRGWFDMRADNIFMNTLGQMYAYHGLLQAARHDFSGIIKTRDLDGIWDRMEQHIAEAAVLSPLIVSNGREDGFLMPDHLSVMAENVLRSRANMTELRDILKR